MRRSTSVCSSGDAAHSAASCIATAAPEALSLAPGTSVPRSSRSASAASEIAMPPSAAVCSAPPPGRRRHECAGRQQGCRNSRDLQQLCEMADDRWMEDRTRAAGVEVAHETHPPARRPAGRHACDDVQAALVARAHRTPASSAGPPRAWPRSHSRVRGRRRRDGPRGLPSAAEGHRPGKRRTAGRRAWQRSYIR